MKEQQWFFYIVHSRVLKSHEVKWKKKSNESSKCIFGPIYIALHLGLACPSYDGQVSVGSFLNSSSLMELRRHLSFHPHLMPFRDYNRE